MNNETRWVAAVQGQKGWVSTLETADEARLDEKYRVGVFDTFEEADQALEGAMNTVRRKAYPDRARVADRILDYLGWPQSEFRKVFVWLSHQPTRLTTAMNWMAHKGNRTIMGVMIDTNMNLGKHVPEGAAG